MLLLVDALDEAQTYTGLTLPDLLCRLNDLPAGVRILATTRDDPEVLKFFRSIKPFDLIRDANPNVEDVRTYAAQRLTKLAAVEKSTRNAFAERLSNQASGVFLYAAMVLDELLERLPGELPDLATYPLPDGLSGVYHDFVVRKLGKDEQRWFDLYEPLLGIIAVSQGDGLTARQLKDVMGKDVRAALRACKQYLSGQLPEGPFRPFHKSFADFLLEDEDNVDFHIDTASMHRRIADAFGRDYAENWGECEDTYALGYMPTHLREAAHGASKLATRRTLASRLSELLSDFAFLDAKAGGLGVESLLGDLQAALATDLLDDEQKPNLQGLLDLLGREALNLRQWNARQRPALLAQQLYNRAVSMGVEVIAQRALARLETISCPYLQLSWWAGTETPELERTLRCSGHRVRPIVVSTELRLIAAGCGNHPFTLNSWELASGRYLHPISDPDANAAAFTPDGSKAITYNQQGPDTLIKVWDIRLGKLTVPIKLPARSLSAAAVLPDGKHAILGFVDGAVEVCRLGADVGLSRLGRHDSRVRILAVSANGKRLISSAEDGILHIWDLGAPVARHTLPGHGEQVYGAALGPDGQLAISTSSHSLRVWDLRAWTQSRCFELPPLHAYDIATRPLALADNGRVAITTTDSRSLGVWDLTTSQLRKTLSGHQREITAVALAPAADRVVSGDWDGYVKVWNLEKRQGPSRRCGHANWVRAVAFNRTGDLAASGDNDGMVKLWDGVTGDERATLGAETNDASSVIALTEGRPCLLSFSYGRKIRVEDVQQPGHARTIAIPQSALVSEEALFTRDGSQAVLITGRRDAPELVIWSISENKEERRLGVDSAGLGRVALTADCKQIIAAMDDGSLKCWLLATGE
jgi:WD40 repeat protein